MSDSSTDDRVPTLRTANHACVSCSRGKRKCNRVLPACSLCKRAGRDCDYGAAPMKALPRGRAAGIVSRKRNTGQNDSTSGTGLTNLATPPSSITSITRRSSDSPEGQTRQSLNDHASMTSQLTEARNDKTRFPAAWFLDSYVAKHLEINVRRDLQWNQVFGVQVSAPSVNEACDIAKAYIDTIDPWFPIISQVRLSRYLKSAKAITDADAVAMFWSMRLLCSTSTSRSLASTNSYELMYDSIKACIAHCIRHGQLTTNLLVAQVLITLHECGQGLYPAAYFSVAECSRMCSSTGLNDKRWASQLGRQTHSWNDAEERRRLWWATLILDRYISLGFQFRPLATATILHDELLPAHDDAFRRGEMTVNPLLVMSLEARSTVGHFAHTCQAAHLLGWAIQHTSEYPAPADPELFFDEAQRICRALQALLALLNEEKQNLPLEERPKLYSSLGLTYSALIILFDVHACIEGGEVQGSRGLNRGRRLELQQMALDGFKNVCGPFDELIEEIRTRTGNDVNMISPLILNALYQAGSTFAWFVRENGNEAHLASLRKTRELFTLLSSRWNVAGDYLLLLKHTEEQSLTCL